MKKVLPIIACFLIAMTATHAQKPDSTKSDKTTQSKKELLKDVDLSKDQQKQIEDIKKQQKEEKDKIMNDKTLNDSQRQEKLKSLDKDTKKKIGGVLTPEQKEKIKMNKEAAKSKPERK